MAHRLDARRVSGILAAVLAALLIPATALAATGPGIVARVSGGATVDVVGVQLNSKLLATINLAVTCDEITYFDWETWEELTTTEGVLYGEAQLLQAQGRSIAAAYGSAWGESVTCDGSTVNAVAIHVIADNLPLKRGEALVGASVYVGAQSGEGNEHYATTGPVTVRLGK